MTIGTTGFVGERLIEAREARGLSNASFAEILDVVSPQAISQYERGKVSPRPEVLQLIADKLNLPERFFLRPAEKESHETLFWRSLSSATKAARMKGRRRFEWLKEIVSYLKTHLDFPRVNLPGLSIPRDVLRLTDDAIEDAANECREYWRIGDGPIADLILFLENNGIIVSRSNLGAEKLDAFSQWADNDGCPYIFLTADKNSAARSRLDAAHELAHLILHRDVHPKQFANTKNYKILEDQAFRFASAFLLPAGSFTSELWMPTLDAFRSLKERWRVSIGAMIRRSHELELLTDDEAKRMWINYNRRNWRKVEPLDDRLQPEQPRLLRRSFELLVQEQIRTRDQIRLELPFSVSDIEELATLPRGFLTGDVYELPVAPKIKSKPTAELATPEQGTLIPFGKRSTPSG